MRSKEQENQTCAPRAGQDEGWLSLPGRCRPTWLLLGLPTARGRRRSGRSEARTVVVNGLGEARSERPNPNQASRVIFIMSASL
jgi:hypothetical protein